MNEKKPVNVNSAADAQSLLNDGLGLLPCPFCGSNARLAHKRGESKVECKGRFFDCPMNMRTHYKATDKDAIKAWNTRA